MNRKSKVSKARIAEAATVAILATLGVVAISSLHQKQARLRSNLDNMSAATDARISNLSSRVTATQTEMKFLVTKQEALTALMKFMLATGASGPQVLQASCAVLEIDPQAVTQLVNSRDAMQRAFLSSEDMRRNGRPLLPAAVDGIKGWGFEIGYSTIRLTTCSFTVLVLLVFVYTAWKLDGVVDTAADAATHALGSMRDTIWAARYDIIKSVLQPSMQVSNVVANFWTWVTGSAAPIPIPIPAQDSLPM